MNQNTICMTHRSGWCETHLHHYEK